MASPAAASELAQQWRRAGLSFAVSAILLLVLFFPTWRSMASTWWNTTTFNYGMIVLPISMFLIWQRRRALAGMWPVQDMAGLVLVGCFALIWLVGTAGEVALFQHIAVVGLLIGLLVACFGRAIARTLWFPLLFLAFMVPFGNFLIPHLQAFVGAFVTLLLRLVGVPVFHEGTLLMTPSGVFEVAEACAGLRFIIANVVVAALFAYWAYDRPIKWFWLLVISVLVPVIANGLRAFGIVYIAYLTDNEYATGVDHLVYGWGFFVLTMFLILFIGNRFADRPIGWFDEDRAGRTTTPVRGSWGAGFVAVLLAVLVAGPAYARLMMQTPEPPTGLEATAMAGLLDTSWQRADGQGDWRPRVAGADLRTHETYASGGKIVDVFVAYFAFERPRAEAVNEQNRLYDGETWIRTQAGVEPVAIDGLPPALRREQLASPQLGSRRLVLWWYWIGGEFVTSAWWAKALQVRDRLLGRAPPAAIVAVSTRYQGPPEEALQTLESFLRSGFAPIRYLAALSATETGR